MMKPKLSAKLDCANYKQRWGQRKGVGLHATTVSLRVDPAKGQENSVKLEEDKPS